MFSFSVLDELSGPRVEISPLTSTSMSMWVDPVMWDTDSVVTLKIEIRICVFILFYRINNWSFYVWNYIDFNNTHIVLEVVENGSIDELSVSWFLSIKLVDFVMVTGLVVVEIVLSIKLGSSDTSFSSCSPLMSSIAIAPFMHTSNS